MKIYFIRHAESEYNKFFSHLIGGRSNYSPLSSEGIIQAKLLGEYFRDKNIVFDKVFSSPAVRTVDTAWISLKLNNFNLDDIVLSDHLQELDQGDFVGKIRTEAYASPNKELIESDPWNFSAPNGESQKQVEKRMLNFIYNDVLKNNYNSVAIFSHGMAIKCLYRGIMNTPPKDTYKMQIDNTAISEFDYDGKNFNLIRFNDTSHLKNFTSISKLLKDEANFKYNSFDMVLRYENSIPKIDLQVLDNVLVHVHTQNEYDTLMQVYEAGDWMWSGNYLPTSINEWKEHNIETCVDAGKTRYAGTDKRFSSEYKRFRCGSKKWYKYTSPVISLGQFFDIQKIKQPLLSELNDWYDTNRPNRASKG